MKKHFFSIFVFAALLMSGCGKEDVPQPPEAAIESPETTFVAQGASITLNAIVTSPSEASITWSVGGAPVAGETGRTFEFSSATTGEHVITLTVKNKDGEVDDEIIITVYYLIDFDDVGAQYLAGPTSYGENLYSDFGAGQYIGYENPSGLKMMLKEAPHWSGSGDTYEFWNGGIAISQWNDMTTEGFTNQCSVFYEDNATGDGGYDGSKTFAVNNGNGEVSFDDGATEATFYYFWVTNSTYAALSMQNGDAVGKKFGTGDWFKLTVNAFDKNGTATGTAVEFYLADFRTATSPGIVTEWTKVDLTPLGNNVHTIKFGLESTDTGDWGMNTPAYFCFDNLAFLKK